MGGFIAWLYLVLGSLGCIEFGDNIKINNYFNKPTTYFHILFYMSLPLFLPFLGLYMIYLFFNVLFCELCKFMIQVHKNSTQPKKYTTFSKAINSMHKYRDNMRPLKNKRPIPEILEELDEAVEERDK